MTKSDVRARVESVFSDLFGVEVLVKARDLEKPFLTAEEAKDCPGASELLDSLDQVEFSMTIEDEFDIKIDDDDAAKLISLAITTDFVAERLGITEE